MEIDKFSKYKALLDSLLKNSLDDKLKLLEQRSKDHESIISTTKEITNNIAVLTLKIQEQLLLKLKEKKKNSIIKIKRTFIRNTTSPKSFIIKRRQSGMRTPIRPTQTVSKQSGTKTSINTKKLDFKLRRHMTEISDLNKTVIEKAKTTFNNQKFKKETIENSKINKTFLNSFNKKFEKKKLNGTSIISLRLKDKDKDKSSINLIDLYNYTNDNIKNKENGKNKNENIKSRNKNNGLTNKSFKNNENINNDCNKSLIKRALVRKKRVTSKNTLLNSSKKNKFQSSNSIQKLKNKKTYDSYNSTKAPNKTKKTNDKIENSNKKNIILGYNNKKPEKEKVIKNEKIADDNNNKQKLFSMDTIEKNLQKSDPLLNDEPLLITPITDSDFLKGAEIFSNLKDYNKSKNIIELFRDKELYFDKIFEFISLVDLIQLKRVSKFFNTKILNYFVKNLSETKTRLISIKNEISSISEQKSLSDMKFSEGAESSIKLLNENIMIKFFQESRPPRDDILFIFEVFFQMINKPIKDAYNNKKTFWEKCCLYFLNEAHGKIGDMLNNIIKNNKIDVFF